MKKYKLSVLLFIISSILLIGIISVYADTLGKSVKLTTTIQSWSPSYGLEFVCGSGPTGLDPTLTIRNTSGVLQQGVSCASPLNISTLTGVTAGETIYIDEVYDFTNYAVTGLEGAQYTLIPGYVDTTGSLTDDDVDDYIFDNYDPQNETVYIYKVNEVDNNNVPTGNIIVDYAYLMNGNEKAASLDVGTVRCPTFCVDFFMQVKGNLSDTTGTFTVTGSRIGTFTGSSGTHHRVCENSSSELLKYTEITQYSAISTVTYTGVSRANDYTIAHSAETDLVESTNGLFLKVVNITATLESGSSPTGVFYKVAPFVILIGFAVGAVIILKKNKLQEVEEEQINEE